MSFSIILPVLNEVGNIERLIEKIINIFENTYEFEIIVVDDNSSDGTSEVLQSLVNKNKNIKHILRKCGPNLVDSLNTGIESSSKEYLIWMDCDFSHPPIYLNKIFNYIKNYDVIVFSRFLIESKRYYLFSKKKPLDYLSNFLNLICRKFLYENFTDYSSGYICIKSKLINESLRGYYGDYFIYLICKQIRMKRSIIELPYIENPRISGYSKTTFGKLNFIIKCYYYFLAVVRNFLLKFM